MCGSDTAFFLSQTRNSIFFLRYVNLFSSCSGLVRENQSPRPVFSAFSGLAQLFLPPRPARADFSFLFPSCNGIFGSRKSFFLLRTRNKTDKLLHTSIDPKKAKNRSSIKLEKMHPIDWEKIAPGRQKKQPAQNAPAVRTFPFSKFYFFCRLLFFLHCGCLHCRHGKSRNDPLSRSGLTP